MDFPKVNFLPVNNTVEVVDKPSEVLNVKHQNLSSAQFLVRFAGIQARPHHIEILSFD